MSCIVCSDDAAKTQHQETDLTSVECPRCGVFFVSGTLKALWQPADKTPQQIANASGWIRENPGVPLHSKDLSMLETLGAPSVAERAQRLLQNLTKSFPALNAHFIAPNPVTNPSLNSITYSAPNEVGFLFKNYLLEEMEYVRKIVSNQIGSDDQYVISPKGHAYLEKLRTANADSQIGFCAMWFDDSVTRLWSEGISKAIENARYEPKRIDKHQHNNKIDDEIIAMIRRSRFVVADFTGQRGGVYFEAGFALGLNIPVIWTCRADELKNVHFDNRQYNFVVWKIEELPAFIESLQNRIEATLGRGRYVKSNQISNTDP